MAGKKKIDFVFVDLTQGKSASVTASQQQRVRAHAAYRAHAAQREKRTIEYQASLKKSEKDKEVALQAVRQAVEREAIELETDALSIYQPLPVESGGLSAQERYLLRQYTRPSSVFPQFPGLFTCYIAKRNSLKTIFVQLAARDPGTLNGICAVTARHLSKLDPRGPKHYELAAMQYKVKAIKALSQRVSQGSGSVGIAEVVTAVLLALDEIALNDWASAETHVHGIVRLLTATRGIKPVTPNTVSDMDAVEHIVHEFIDVTPLRHRPDLQPKADPATGISADSASHIANEGFMSLFLGNHREYVRVMRAWMWTPEYAEFKSWLASLSMREAMDVDV